VGVGAGRAWRLARCSIVAADPDHAPQLRELWSGSDPAAARRLRLWIADRPIASNDRLCGARCGRRTVAAWRWLGGADVARPRRSFAIAPVPCLFPAALPLTVLIAFGSGPPVAQSRSSTVCTTGTGQPAAS